MSQSILVHVATTGGRIKRSSLETLTRCRKVARGEGLRLDAVLIDANPRAFVNAVSEYGPDRVLTMASPLFADHVNPPVLAALEAAVHASQPRLVAFASTESVKDVLGALAARLSVAVIPDVASFELSGTQTVALRPVMAAKKLARTVSEAPCVLVSVRSGSYNAEPDPTQPEVVDVAFRFDEASQRQTLREVVRSGGSAVDLAEAAIVVAAGRGVKDEAGRALIEALASELGAAVGATRAVVESGLYPATAQIGQTGKVVAPQLYVAVGISGAIQHVAGMANSKVIVAINKDGDAPIFDYATYGVVGDLFKVIPELVEQLRVLNAMAT
jgi:electron transfer flavoprotein alpha subunit